MKPATGTSRREEARSTHPGVPGPGHGEEAGRQAGQVQDGGEGTGEGREGVQFPGPSAGRLPFLDTH